MEGVIYAIAAGLFVVLLFLPARYAATRDVVDDLPDSIDPD